MKKTFHLFRLGAMLSLGVLLTSCMLLDEAMPPKPDPMGMGYARMYLELERPADGLRKAASEDTAFSIDSLIVVLTATGASTQTYSYPLSGRADLGNISVPVLNYELTGLRTWKAKFISIDTTTSPLRRDTVHLDSVTFQVTAGQTTALSKTVSPVYSILRVRFISTNQDSIVTPVRFLRLRVNGVTRDSVPLGGSNASLKWLQAMSGSTIHAAGDSGRVLRSTNDGALWTEQRLTSNPLVGGHFTDANTGFVVSNVGTMYRTDNGGDGWQERMQLPLTNGVRDTISAIYFPSADYGFVVGQNGSIFKTNDGWQGWRQISNTAYNLNGLHFPTATTGFVVGENETILKTTNAQASGGDAGNINGIVFAPVAGGWFYQTSNTTEKITSIHFTSASVGWAVGYGGYVRKTTNGGATWEPRSSSGDVNALSFLTPTRAFTAGNAGLIQKMDINENNWAAMSNGLNTINGRNLYDIQMATTDTGYAVGASGAVLRTVNASGAAHEILWLSQLGWYPVSGIPDWKHLYSVRFALSSRDTGWVVGSNGTIYKTGNRGGTWVEQSSGTSSILNELYAHNGQFAVAVGNSGVVRRTTNGGANWNTITLGPPAVSGDLRGVAFTSATVGWLVGQGNVIRKTNDGGATWQSKDETGNFYGVAVGANRVWVVGDAGKVLRSGNLGHNTNFSTVATAGTGRLNAVEFVTPDTGWVVGAAGKIYRTVTGDDATVTWTPQAVNLTGQDLTHVHFLNQRIGYISGNNGIVLKTTNSGGDWTIQNTETNTDLKDIYPIDTVTVYAVGPGGKIFKTSDGGEGDTTTFRSVYAFTDKLVYASGSGGRILKTTNAGENWVRQTSGTSVELNAISFRTATAGVAVGKSGKIFKTTNGGTSWVEKSSSTLVDLLSVKFVANDTGYAVGKSGTVVKTVDGGENWYGQETPTNVSLNKVHAFSKDLVFAVGDSGKILKAVNEGDNWTGSPVKRSLKGVYFPSTTVGYIVGSNGTIIKTTNGGDFWTRQTSSTALTLYGVYFTDVSTGWVTGENGTVLKTTNGGTNWSPQTSGQPSTTLRWTHFRNSSRGFMIGGSQALVSTTNGGSNWTSSFVGVPGLRTFDATLSYKYLKPNQSNIILFEAIDQVSPLRGYQGSKTVIIGAGADSTITSPLTRCGYGIPACL